MKINDNYMNHTISSHAGNYTELDPDGIMTDIAKQSPTVEEALDEMKRLRAEKRLNARLRKMETEQKARLLAETQQRMAEARRRFDFLGSVKDDEMPGFPSTSEDMLQAMKAREELMAMEREQKKRLLQDTLEMQGRHLGEEWPAARDPLYRKFLAEAFPGHHSVRLEGSNE